MRRALPLVLALALGLALVACSERGGAVSRRAAIEAFGAQSGQAPFAGLSEAIVADPEGTHQAALDLIASGDPDVRIAALYALSVTARPEDAETFAPFLESADAGERVLAGAALVALGDRRSVPVLIDSLGEDDALPFGFPPVPVWREARYALLQSTGQELGLREATTADQAAAAIPAWEAWWTSAGPTFEVVAVPDPLGG
jgi:hypothetical protein